MGITARKENEAPEEQVDVKTISKEEYMKVEEVEEVTVDMILLDLAKGLSRTDIQKKYRYRHPDTDDMVPFEKWMVDEMFKDPALKGKTPDKARRLPFAFKGSEDTPVRSQSNIAPLERANAPKEAPKKELEEESEPKDQNGSGDGQPFAEAEFTTTDTADQEGTPGDDPHTDLPTSDTPQTSSDGGISETTDTEEEDDLIDVG